jgi:hypothetical protein
VEFAGQVFALFLACPLDLGRKLVWGPAGGPEGDGGGLHGLLLRQNGVPHPALRSGYLP